VTEEKSQRAVFAETLSVSRETLARFDRYAALLEKWQARINLVSTKTLPDVWIRHFLDSGQLLSLAAEHRPGGLPATWLDLGSGAGFPGLVLALLRAGEVHLVESDARKCAFLRQVIRETGAPAQVHQCRIEAGMRFRVDIVTARALASLEELFGYAALFWGSNTEGWFLKGRGCEEELTRATRSWTVRSDIFPSRTDREGRILRVRSLARVR